uniref:Methylase n=1 Tax=uncultured Thiotrichaceae bacterium TaxID=298394 RepID=A0A6S6STF5_9GAMM|nr:MAG: FIG01059727: hypothetical protein [uncultured Thiotrichaceae bacterium]
MKPFSESCVQNCTPILEVLRPLLVDRKELLEIGSGTGQHAVYFAPEFPNLIWQTSDISAHHPGIQLWLEEAAQANIRLPLTLDVLQADWPAINPDAVFSANTLHIMDSAMVEACITGVGELLQSGGLYIVYGPFNYNGEYTSESNARFDQWLAQRNAGSAIRDFEWVNELATDAGMALEQDIAMPANNRILVWRKS